MKIRTEILSLQQANHLVPATREWLRKTSSSCAENARLRQQWRYV